MWVYLLRNKSDAFGAFKRFRALVEDGPERKVKMLRTDRGGEFMSAEFMRYCEATELEDNMQTPTRLSKMGSLSAETEL